MENPRYGQAYYYRNRHYAVFRPPGGDRLYVETNGKTRGEALLALAIVKIEWLANRMLSELGKERATEIVENLSGARGKC